MIATNGPSSRLLLILCSNSKLQHHRLSGNPKKGGVGRGAARGAAVGAVAGGIAKDDAGKGAATGAATGAVVGGIRRRDQRRQ